MPESSDATNADRSIRLIAVWADEVTRRRHAWLAAREVARQLKEDYDAAVFELYGVIAAETMPPPPSAASEGGPGS
jgi:hypothetical protein